MAASKEKKTTTTKKKPAAKKGSGRTSAAKAPQKRPIRREVGGVVLLLLALFTTVSYFKVSAIFVDAFAALLKGLFGYGYWLAAPAMLLAGIILLFHHGRPVQLKVTSSLILPLLMGSLCHMFFCKETYESSIGIVKELWNSGKELASGGVIAGALAEGSAAVFSKTASVIIFVVLFAVLAMTVLWPVISKMRKKHQERTRYVEEPEKEKAVMPVLPRESAKRTAEEKKQQIDFPLEGERRAAEPAEKKEGRFTSFFRHKDEGQKTPDQVLMEKPAAATPAIPAREEAAVVEEAKAPAVQPLDPVSPNEFTRTPYVKPAAPSPMPIQEEPAPSAKKEKVTTAKEVAAQTAAVTAEIEEKLATEEELYQFPPITLLKASKGENHMEAGAELRNNSRRLAETLTSFGVDATPADVVHGPAVTR